MGFNIIEGCSFNPEDYLDDFVRLYNDRSILVKDIRREFGFTINQYNEVRNICLERGLIRPRYNWDVRKKKEVTPKYYSLHRVGFNERWCVKRKGINYGMFKNVKQAKKMVDLLNDCDWDLDKVEDIRKFCLEHY